ncbi:MAG TPA: TIGR04282 family arsenosugar biosynthesis glycosyltransferase [Burkholderiales bacterium]
MFSRRPVPGRVKTRLVPRLGEWGAARLHERLTAHTLRTAAAARCGPVELIDSARQRGAHLGARMHHALAHALRRHRGAILIGSDCPALRAAHLERAARWLAGGCDAVLGPAEDGGYVLIGASRLSPRLFSGIEWGGPCVYQATARELDALGYRWRALPTLWDVDRPEDLERLRALRFASAPRRCARR